MNSKQLQYAILLSQVRNFSQVAEKLNISQPSLSKQIQSLENELGVQLFNRDTVPLTVTAAGEYFIREAQDMIYKEDQLLRSMERFRSGEEGRLVIGVSPFRSLYLMPGFVKKLREKYPRIQVCLHEPPSDEIRKEAAEGKYDFAIVNLPVDESVLEAVPIEREQLVLAVPNHMLHKLPELPAQKMPQINLADCKELPFVTAKQPLEMRRYFDQLCARADIRPNIAVEVTGLTTAWAMARAGVGAALLPLQFVSEGTFDEGVTLVEVRDGVSARQPVVVTRRGQYLPEYAQYAIALLTDKS